MAPPAKFRDQTYFVQLLEDIADGIENTGTEGYQFAESDRWSRTRLPGQWTAHLQFWVGFADVLSVDSESLRQRCVFYAALRYVVDDDSVSQARMQAAARDAMEYLLAYRGPDGERSYNIEGITFQPTEKASTYIEAVIPFDMILPRKRG